MPFSLCGLGASITMAKGASDAGLIHRCRYRRLHLLPFGITSLFDCVMENTPITIIILDNSTTGMTGARNHMVLVDSKAFGLGLGVEKEHIHMLNPLPNITNRTPKSLNKN
jgi:indolepyruvate ferredoxin oxidoreductase alpha subunit